MDDLGSKADSIERSALTIVEQLKRRNRFLAVVVGCLVAGGVSFAGLTAWFFIDDRNDDRATARRREAAFREECEQDNRQSADIREGLTVFTDALIAAADDADPAQVEAFRRDLQARLAEAVPDRLCDAESQARRIGRRLTPAELQPPRVTPTLKASVSEACCLGRCCGHCCPSRSRVRWACRCDG